jgi:Tfp pilus assembly protein PilE
MMRSSTQHGFSAVELLISMFIAVAFIGAGYQLYSVIIKDGLDARLRSTASNIAYSNLRFYAPQATNPCTSVTPNPTPTAPTANQLPNGSITVTIDCPYGVGDQTSRILVSVKYGTPQQEVIHEIYASN